MGPLWRRPSSSTLLAAALATPAAPAAGASTLGKLLVFFLKAGALTFGSGLVIVPFLQQGVVQQYGWLSERDFLVAVAVGMISPGPVVITATFVGYLVAGFGGALAATIGIFLPSFLLVLLVAPILARHRANRNVQGFIKGAYAAAIGTILGACVLLGRIAIGDWFTIVLALDGAGRPVSLEGQQSASDGRHGSGGPDCISLTASGLGHGAVSRVSLRILGR